MKTYGDLKKLIKTGYDKKFFTLEDGIEDYINSYLNKKNKIYFENLTLVPIEKELINYKLLSPTEKNYLFRYHFEIYSKLSKYLNLKEKRWLASFIQ